jgi:hypothetical protein
MIAAPVTLTYGSTGGLRGWCAWLGDPEPGCASPSELALAGQPRPRQLLALAPFAPRTGRTSHSARTEPVSGYMRSARRLRVRMPGKSRRYVV